MLLAFVRCGWQEQIVLPGIEGIGSGELRATVASNKKEFCLVTGGYWALESTERRRYTTFCPLCQSISNFPTEQYNYNLLYDNLSSSAPSWWVSLTPSPAGFKSTLLCDPSPLHLHLVALRAGQG